MVVKIYTDEFDPNYYMNKYPDIKNAFGTNTCDLFTHYQNFGIKEGRFPSYNVEKQTQLSNPTFSQNYIKYNDFRIGIVFWILLGGLRNTLFIKRILK